MGSQDKMETIEAVTYVFSIDGPTRKDKEVAENEKKMRVWQIVPSVCASMCVIPYGLMLGWPSPTYPMLLKPDSPIFISYDQSAIIAGFLMIGNFLGTPISTKTIVAPRYGILIGIAFMTSGWFVMWQARDFFWLLASRILVGFGNGYGTGQLKMYIAQICDDDLKALVLKHINLYVFFAVLAMFSIGPFLDFRQTSVVCLLTSILIFFVCLLLPSSPKELVRANQTARARRMIAHLKPDADVDNELGRLKGDSGAKEQGFVEIFKRPALLKSFGVFAFLVFCQQCSGAPATIIYTQIMFERSHCPHAVYIAIVYAVLFFFSNVIGIFLVPKYNKRTVLLFSSCSVVLLVIAKICVILLKVNEKYWSYSSVAVMYLYIVVHT
uniref:Putative sugar transporter n=1 Tax=Phaedon cochleariae TaxID=80249 RepID=W4VRX9_PHACE